MPSYCPPLVTLTQAIFVNRCFRIVLRCHSSFKLFFFCLRGSSFCNLKVVAFRNKMECRRNLESLNNLEVQTKYDADAYSSNLQEVFRSVSILLKFFATMFEVAPTTKHRQFLDVGSGCGGLTKGLLLPSLPADAERMVAIDMCENMVSHAQRHNANAKIVYEKLDITKDVSEFHKKFGLFERVYAFWSLNRVKDQMTAWKNMAKLLQPGGHCLLFYPAWYVTPEVWRNLARKQSWARFSELWESMIPPTQDMRSTAERLCYARSLAASAGLELRTCELTYQSYDAKEYEEILVALIPGVQSLAVEEKAQLAKDAREELFKWTRGKKNPVLAHNFVIHGVKQ